MKQRHVDSAKQRTRKEQPAVNDTTQAVDNLGIDRGQNAEKGPTNRPEDIVNRKRAEH